MPSLEGKNAFVIKGNEAYVNALFLIIKPN
jgi:hypothetical protein